MCSICSCKHIYWTWNSICRWKLLQMKMFKPVHHLQFTHNRLWSLVVVASYLLMTAFFVLAQLQRTYGSKIGY